MPKFLIENELSQNSVKFSKIYHLASRSAVGWVSAGYELATCAADQRA
ncbi:MAG: hypothetical protein ABL898_19370 [Hyphomicrobiaceae bacterium]|nr:hypothetical protein [Hyphomicrobiaceae bacterium]